MDFVEYDKAIFVAFEEERRIGEFVPILPTFEIQIKGGRFLRQRQRQGRLADLPWPS
jgi:hypothetical protein